MHKPCSREDAPGSGIEAGELNALLREIEKEAVPARLLELALQLQAALAQHRAEKATTDD